MLDFLNRFRFRKRNSVASQCCQVAAEESRIICLHICHKVQTKINSDNLGKIVLSESPPGITVAALECKQKLKRLYINNNKKINALKMK